MPIRLKLAVFAFPLASALLSGALAAQGAAQDAWKIPAVATAISYDQSVSCQAVFVVAGSLVADDPDAMEVMQGFFGAWFILHSRYFPVDREIHHEQDIAAEADRVSAAIEGVSDEEFDALMLSRMDRCVELLEAEPAPQ